MKRTKEKQNTAVEHFSKEMQVEVPPNSAGLNVGAVVFGLLIIFVFKYIENLPRHLQVFPATLSGRSASNGSHLGNAAKVSFFERINVRALNESCWFPTRRQLSRRPPSSTKNFH